MSSSSEMGSAFLALLKVYLDKLIDKAKFLAYFFNTSGQNKSYFSS